MTDLAAAVLAAIAARRRANARMRGAAPLLPPPGGEVVLELLDWHEKVYASHEATIREHRPEKGCRISGEYVCCTECGCSCMERWDDGPSWPCPVLSAVAALYLPAPDTTPEETP